MEQDGQDNNADCWVQCYNDKGGEQVIALRRSIVAQIPTLNNLLEDMGESTKENPIPLPLLPGDHNSAKPTFTSEFLKAVEAFLDARQGSEDSNAGANIVEAASDDLLDALVCGSNWCDLGVLTEIACKTLLDRVNNSTDDSGADAVQNLKSYYKRRGLPYELTEQQENDIIQAVEEKPEDESLEACVQRVISHWNDEEAERQ